jgi:hypothetical protein
MPEFQGNSDKEETFKFASMLLEAGWMDIHAFVNGAATLQVRTLYVAHGSKIKVTVKDKEAKALETVEGFVYADFFRKKVALTAAHAPGIFFEAELPDHGLKAIGQKLIVKPAIRVYEPAWKDKATGKAVTELKRGMDLEIEAKTENLPDGAEARIVNSPPRTNAAAPRRSTRPRSSSSRPGPTGPAPRSPPSTSSTSWWWRRPIRRGTRCPIRR